MGMTEKSLAMTINKLNFNIGIQNNYIADIFKNLFVIMDRSN